jgi:predicted SpoU family rRNA methylase
MSADSNLKILHNLNICSSNIDDSQRHEIQKIIEKLGGNFLLDMRKSTKLLISNKINTDKCLVNFFF